MRDREAVNIESGSADSFESHSGGRIDRTRQLIRCRGMRERGGGKDSQVISLDAGEWAGLQRHRGEWA